MSTLGSGLLTILFPFMIKFDLYLGIAGRILAGALSGPAVPVSRSSLTLWAPRDERSRLVALQIIGCPTGIVSTMLFGGIICQQLHWEYLFYLIGVLCIIWSVLWQLLVFPSPEEDPRISDEEREYIITSRTIISNKSKKVPWGEILSSKPVVALVLSQLSCQWIIYLIFSMFPSFLSDIFNLDIQLVGLISAIPAVACISAGFLSVVGDKLAVWKTTTFSRKACYTVAVVVIVLLCMMFPFIRCNMYLSVTVIVVIAFFVGLGSFVALEPNAVDLSPK